MVELGRIDICCEVSMLSSHLAMPRKGHLDQVYHIFAYLHQHHNAELVFDPTYAYVDEEKFARQDWSSAPYKSDEPEELPLDMPAPRGHGVVIRTFVDADHAGESVTRKSRSGFMDDGALLFSGRAAQKMPKHTHTHKNYNGRLYTRHFKIAPH